MIELDRESLLVHVDGSVRVSDLEAALAKEHLTLDLADVPAVTISAWLESGAPGARSAWLDPADHLVAGFVAHAPKNGSFTIRPAPRRAVGPDLTALVLGTRVLTLESVWLRVHRKSETRPVAKFDVEEEPLSENERALFAHIERELF